MLALVLALVPQVPAQGSEAKLEAGTWHAELASPGGALDFGLEVEIVDDKLKVYVRNCDERIAVPHATAEHGELRLQFDGYDSEIRARIDPEGYALDGFWTKRSGPDRWTTLGFRARLPRGCTMPGGDLGFPPIEHTRWKLSFQSSEDPAVAVFEFTRAGMLGTILTTSGDYRYLSVRKDPPFDPAGICMSCFDGAHAFLLRARWQEDGSLKGDFWSGDKWHETWTAVRDEHAKLPDPFELTKSNAQAKLADLRFPDVTGKTRSPGDAEFEGKARLIAVLGSWCPNCNDEAEFLAELDRRYRKRGLAIVGLAFELTGDFARDARQVELFCQRHSLEFPVLVAGLSDKAEASKSLPVLDKLRAYPTTLFVGRDGTVRAVHQGYSGPATGAEYDKLREDFERRIEALLAEPKPEKQ